MLSSFLVGRDNSLANKLQSRVKFIESMFGRVSELNKRYNEFFMAPQPQEGERMKAGELYDVAQLIIPSITKRMFTVFYNISMEHLSRILRIKILEETFPTVAEYKDLPLSAVRIERVSRHLHGHPQVGYRKQRIDSIPSQRKWRV